MRDKDMLTAAEIRMLLKGAQTLGSQQNTGGIHAKSEEEPEDHKPISFRGRKDGRK